MIIESPMRMTDLKMLSHVSGVKPLLEGDSFQQLIHNGPTWAGLTDSGEVIAAMGMLKQNTTYYQCWAICDEKLLPKYLFPVSRMMRNMLDAYGHNGVRRIETVVRVGTNKKAQKARHWVELLGFSNPVLTRHYDEYGDVWRYERLA